MAGVPGNTGRATGRGPPRRRVRPLHAHAGTPEDDIDAAKHSPIWPQLEAVAHVLPSGAACLGDGRPPTDRLAKIAVPTLVTTGTVIDPHMSRLPADVFDRAADAIVAAVPGAERASIKGQSHMLDPAALAPVLERFFTHEHPNASVA
ncbi:hypothetical protein AB0J74_32130 [Asanoa sp. NPDC049573]|uniref:alpha/beta fold hydrolase n=1 Tax=Asanoa sp. NPDC049573 TaxID=3155396 RepID=UPI0034429B1F